MIEKNIFIGKLHQNISLYASGKKTDKTIDPNEFEHSIWIP